MDSKRRLVVPQEFRALASGPFNGVFCFPSIEADCIEGGGQALFDRYKGVIEELPFGDPLRSALETTVYGGLAQLGWDATGRVLLPEPLCRQFGIETDVVVVGLNDRFQIWAKPAFEAHRETQRTVAREGLAAYRLSQRSVAAA